MTLVIAALNQTNVVVGVDSLRGSTEPLGQVSLDAKKLYKLTNNCFVLIAGSGFNSLRIRRYLASFRGNLTRQGIEGFDEIILRLRDASRRLIGGGFGGDLVFLLAGFESGQPKAQMIGYPEFNITDIGKSYLAAGAEQFAYEMCEDLGLSIGSTTEMIELSIYKILYMTSGQYPDKVGGSMTVEILGP